MARTQTIIETKRDLRSWVAEHFPDYSDQEVSRVTGCLHDGCRWNVRPAYGEDWRDYLDAFSMDDYAEMAKS